MNTYLYNNILLKNILLYKDISFCHNDLPPGLTPTNPR